VAQVRGQRFKFNRSKGIYEAIPDETICRQAMDDVTAWLGFTDWDVYNAALLKHRRAIFKRATY